MKLKFTNKTRPTKVKPEIQRREKLVNRLDQQVSYFRQMIDGQRPSGSWVWMDESGTYFLPIKYREADLGIEKGYGFNRMCKPRRG